MNRMSTSPNSYQHLEPRPCSFYRQLFLKGTRIRADVIYGLYASGEMTPEEIATDYDLPLKAVQEAIAYVASKPPEIASDDAREEALREASGMNDPNYQGQPRILSPADWARIRHL
jgi:uncharacterized protein (DUF433 family)